MKSFGRVSFTILATLFIMSSAIVAVADDDDPPSRVARLKYMSGDVSIQPGGVDDWVAANINRPLTTSDRIWTDKAARAELHLGTSVMRMDSESSVTLTNLSDETVQVALYQGTLNLRIKYLYRGEIYEIDTPNIAFTITKAGEYRFDVDSNRDITFVTVRKGEGVATGDGPAVKVKKNQSARFSDAKSMAHVVSAAPGRDGFDQWCKVRDSRESYYVSARYVSPYVNGYEDLDAHGYWRYAPGYGYLWFPHVTIVDWAPYRYGHWAWISPWGWTWIDDAPWGFAPFHYGRWVYTGGYWGWCPGPRYIRPYYAPALVAWVGGRNWGVGISFGGGVGWFPLGFGEPYIPYYRVSRHYFQQVNITNTRITNVTNITNIYNNVYNTNIRNTNINIDNSRDHIHNNVHIRYANYRVPGAVTGVPRDEMVRGRSVAKARLKFDAKDLDERDIQYRPHATPSKESVLGADRERPAARPARDIALKPVKEKLAPPSKRPSFEQERQAMEREQGRDMDRGERNAREQEQGRGIGRDRDANDASRGRLADRPADDAGRVNSRGNSQAEEQSTGRIRDERAPRTFPRPPKRGEPDYKTPANSNAGQEQRDRMERDRFPAEKNGADSHGRNTDASRGTDRTPEFSNRVPRPPQGARDIDRGKTMEAENQGDREVPRPRMENGGGGNGREQRGTPTNSGNSERRDPFTERQVPRPPAERGTGMQSANSTPSERGSGMGSGRVDRGPAMESPRSIPSERDRNTGPSPSMPSERPQSGPADSPRYERSAPPAPVRIDPGPRSESHVEHAPRPEPQALPDYAAPRQSEAPRQMDAPRSNGGGGGGGQARPAPQGGSEKNQGGKGNSGKASGKDNN
jgi:hypothetical protein